MQKFLFLILGFLGMIFLIEIGILIWQKNTPLSPVTITQTPITISLPYSSQINKNIKHITLSENLVQKGYVGWQEGDFFYNTPKDYQLSVLPFSVKGTVKKIEDKKLEIEAKGNDETTYIVKAELSPNTEIIKTIKDEKGKISQITNSSFLKEIKIGSHIRVHPLIQNWIKDGYFMVTQIFIQPT